MPDEKYQVVGGRAEEVTSDGYRKRKSSKTKVESSRKKEIPRREESEWNGFE
jgi:hypothetical protein